MKKATTPQAAYTARGISIIPIFARTIFGRKTIGPLFRYLGTVMRDFFFLQFAVKFGLKKIQIINVDHPLDQKVPFTPERVSIYLDFVAFWIRPLGYIGKRFGRKKQIEYTARFLAIVDRCYRDAGEVYRFRMTTTKRPKYYKGNFLTIHIFDPHYLCVPSLHIMIVVLAHTFYRRAFAELGMGKEEADALNAEMFGGAIAIAETVLYIKQHSVNCIPAALYAMTRITPDDVSPVDVMEFIKYLFAEDPAISREDAAKIRTYIADMYEILYLEGCHDSTWITPLQRWLNKYAMEGFVN